MVFILAFRAKRGTRFFKQGKKPDSSASGLEMTSYANSKSYALLFTLLLLRAGLLGSFSGLSGPQTRL